MAYKKKNPYRKSITFFILTGIFFVGVILFGLTLLQNELITVHADEETIIEIENPGSYYILIHTDGKRYATEINEVGATNELIITNDEEELYEASVIAKGDEDATATTIENIDFDNQIRYKGYLSFGKMSLNQDIYTFNGTVINNLDEFGDYALLRANYVTQIGAFSMSAMITLLFGLLGFKHFRSARKLPLSKYQRKHIKI